MASLGPGLFSRCGSRISRTRRSLGQRCASTENTPDAHLIVDRHPQAANAWIVGGGSGHGFKMGPALGEMVASLVLDDAPVDPQFGLARFAALPRGGRWT